MSEREELQSLRRLAELEAKAGGDAYNPADVGSSSWLPPGVERFAAGAGKAVYDTGRGLGQLLGLVSKDDVAESRKRDAPLMDTGAGLTGNIAGNVGMALAPGGLLRGAGSFMGMVPSMTRAAPAVSAAGKALMAPQTIKGSLAAGAGFGLAQPALDWQERAVNTGLGAAATAAVPVAGRALHTAKAAIEPTYDEGQKAILGRVLRRATAPDQAAVLQRLDEAAAPFVGPQQGVPREAMGELVPGWKPTAAQAGESPGLATMQRSAAQTLPEVMNPHVERATQQGQALVNAMEDMAGSGGARDFAVANRDATAQQLYDQAYQRGINLGRNASTGGFVGAGSQAGTKGEITKLLANPYIADAVQEARVLMRGEFKGVRDPTGSVQGLDYVKRALDDKIDAALRAGKNNEARIIGAAKDRLLTTLDRLSPDYAAARQVYAEMSRPVDQMDIAQEILDKSRREGLQGDRLLPEAFKRNVSDETAKRATGFRGATLEGALEPGQRSMLDLIKEALMREQFAANAGRAGSDTVQKMAMTNLMDTAGVSRVPTLLSRPAMLANYAMNRVYSAADKEMQRKLAEALLSPADTAAIMRIPDQSARVMAFENAMRQIAAPAGMAAPALLNAQQQ